MLASPDAVKMWRTESGRPLGLNKFPWVVLKWATEGERDLSISYISTYLVFIEWSPKSNPFGKGNCQLLSLEHATNIYIYISIYLVISLG